MSHKLSFMSPLAIIIGTVLRESLRTRFWLVYGLILLISFSTALFISQLTLTDSQRSLIITFATLIRPLAAAQLILHVAASTNRETHEKGLDMILAAGISPAILVAGRLLGFCLMGMIMALAAGLLLLGLDARHELAIWVVGLAGEQALLAGFAFAAALSLRQVVGGVLAAVFLYLLGHNLSALLLLADHPVAGDLGTLHSVALWPFKALSWLIPRFDLFGSADWLAGLRSGQLLPILAQTAIYLVLLFALSAIDLTRNRER
jgi:hypothetical protein